MALSNPISTGEAAKILGISASRVRQLILDGRLEAKKVGRDQILDRKQVEQFAITPRKRTGRPKKGMS